MLTWPHPKDHPIFSTNLKLHVNMTVIADLNRHIHNTFVRAVHLLHAGVTEYQQTCTCLCCSRTAADELPGHAGVMTL